MLEGGCRCQRESLPILQSVFQKDVIFKESWQATLIPLIKSQIPQQQNMSNVAILFGTLVLFFLYLWKYHVKPRKVISQYRKLIEKEGFVVSHLGASGFVDVSSEGKNVISFDQTERKQLKQDTDVALREIQGAVCLTILNENLIKEFLDNIKFKTSESLIEANIECQKTHFHEGGLSSVQMEKIIKYVRFLESLPQSYPWKESMLKLKNLISFDPVLRLNWEQGIKQSTKLLPNKTGNYVLALINKVLYTPPSFESCSTIGVPINAILLQFMQCENGRAFFSHPKINQIFKQILNDYGKMLQSRVSLKYMTTKSPKGWFCAEAHEKVDYSLYQCNLEHPNYGFVCWNDWFLREFKDGVRPIGAYSPINVDPTDVIVNACESTPLSQPLQPARNVRAKDEFWLKDSRYSLNDMFGQQGQSKKYGSLFEGGTVYQAFLSALYYHHWHAPIDGTIEDIYSIEGTYFLDNSQNLEGFDIQSPVESQSFLSATAVRMVMLIKADNPKIGYIALIFIGMVEVSTCVSVVQKGDKVKKGEKLGHFMFGGSSHTVLFQKQAKLTFASEHYETSSEGKKIGKIQELSSYLAHLQE